MELFEFLEIVGVWDFNFDATQQYEVKVGTFIAILHDILTLLFLLYSHDVEYVKHVSVNHLSLLEEGYVLQNIDHYFHVLLVLSLLFVTFRCRLPQVIEHKC